VDAHRPRRLDERGIAFLKRTGAVDDQIARLEVFFQIVGIVGVDPQIAASSRCHHRLQFGGDQPPHDPLPEKSAAPQHDDALHAIFFRATTPHGTNRIMRAAWATLTPMSLLAMVGRVTATPAAQAPHASLRHGNRRVAVVRMIAATVYNPFPAPPVSSAASR